MTDSTRHLEPLPSTREEDPYVTLFVALFGHAPKMPKPKLQIVE